MIMTSKYDEGDKQHSFDDHSCNGDDNDNNDEYDDHSEEYYNEHDDGDKLGYDDNDESSSSAHSQQQSSMAPTMTASRSSRSRSSSRYRDEYLRPTLARTNTTDDDDEAVLRRERTVNALRQLNHMVLGSSFGNSNSSSRSSRSRMRGSDDDTSSRAPQLRVSPSSGRWRVVTPTTSKEYEEDNNEEEYEEDNNEEEYEEHDYVQSYYHDEKEDDEDKEEDYDEDDDGTYVDNSNNRYIEAEEGVQDYNNSHYQEDQQWSEQQRRSNNSYHDAGRNQQLQPAPPTTHSRFVSGTVVREDSGGSGSSCAFYPQPFKSQKQRTYHRTSSNNIINNNNKGRGTKSLPSSRPGFTPPMQQQPRSPESDHPPPLTMEEDVISTMSASAITIGSRKPKLTHQQQQLQLLARADSNSRAVIPTKVVFPIKTSRNEGGTRCLSQQQHQQYYSRRTTNELEMSDAIIVRPSYNKPLSSIDSRPRPNKMVGRGKSFSSATTTTTRRSSIDRSTKNNVVQSRRSSLMRMISDGDNSSRRRTRSSSRGGSIDRSTRSSSQGGGSSRRRTRYSSRSSGRKDSQQRSIVSTRIRSQSLERRDGNGRRPSSNDYRRPSSSTVRSMSKGRRTTPTSYINNDMIISRPKKMQEEYNNDWRITTSKSLMMQQHHNIDDEGYCQYHPDIRLMKLRQDGRWRVLRKKCQKCSSASSRCISNSRGGNLARSSSRSSHHRSRRIAYDHYDNDYDDDDSRSYIDSTTMEVESAATSSSPTESMSFLDLGMSLQTPEEMEAEEATNRLKRRLAARAYHFPGNTWWQDWLQYLSNTHTVLGLFFHHPLHPMRFKERVVMLLGSIAIGLTISNFTYMYYIKNGYSMDEVVVDLGFVVVTRLMITLWTLGSFIHTIFDLLLWHTKACTICRYKGQFDESLSRWGRVFGLFVVGCAMFAGAYAVLLRASIDYKDEGSISEEVMESIKSNEIYRIEFEDKRSFKFLMGYLIEFVLAMFVYYPIAVTILFSGVLGCGGRIPILGGRPREMKKETRYEMNKRQPKILKALNIEGDWSDLSGSRTYSRSDIV